MKISGILGCNAMQPGRYLQTFRRNLLPHRQITMMMETEDLVRAVVNCRVCELAIALKLLVVTICKCSVNPITNPNAVCSQSRDNIFVADVE
jgi:hypothetical protein